MHLVTSLCVLCVFALAVTGKDSAEDLHYNFPDVTIEAYSPRGLQVSIPDDDGVQLFAFHGNVNKMLNYVDAGDLSKDIVRKRNGRWTFEADIALQAGDTLYYWLFVIRNNLGYRLDNQRFTVHKLLPQPEGFMANRKRPSRPKSTPKPPLPSSTVPAQKPTQEDVQPCECIPCSPVATPSTTTVFPPLGSSTPSTIHTIVNIWAESLNNATEEKIDLVNRVQYLSSINEHLRKIVEFSKSPDMNKLKITGRIPTKADPDSFVISVIKDKLHLKDRIINADRMNDNSIVFEMEDYQGKLNVLYEIKEKLMFSQMVITDCMLEVNCN